MKRLFWVLALSVASVVGTAIGADKYIDPSAPLNGSGDSSADPYNSFSELNAIKGNQGGDVWRIRRNTETRAAIFVRDAANFVIDAYGAGPRPVINGSDIVLDTWVLSAEYPDVWSIQVDKDRRLHVVGKDIMRNNMADIEDIEAWQQAYEPAVDENFGPNFLYLKTDGTDPNTIQVEISIRKYPVLIGTVQDFVIRNLHLTKAYVHCMLITAYPSTGLTRDVTIEDIEASYCGAMQSSGRDGIKVVGNRGTFSPGFVFRRIEAHHAWNNGIEVESLDGAIFEYNHLHHNAFNAFEMWYSTKNSIFRNNIVHDSNRLAWFAEPEKFWTISSWDSDGREAVIVAPGYDLFVGEPIELTGTEGLDGIHAVSALLDNDSFSILSSATGAGTGGTLQLLQDHRNNVIVNNLAYSLSGSAIAIDTGVDNQVHNNTLVTTKFPALRAKKGSGLLFMNNIAVQVADGVGAMWMYPGTGIGTLIDNNVYFNPDRPAHNYQPKMIWEGVTYSSSPFLDWQVASGQDSASVSGQNPEFVDADSADYQLSEASIARYENTPGVALVATDLNDDPRIGGYDIGAFQFERVDIEPIFTLTATYAPPVGARLMSYYWDGLRVSGGQPPYSFSIAAASNLPAGLTLQPAPWDNSIGTIWGYPENSTVGVLPVTIEVTDAVSNTEAMQVEITVLYSSCGAGCHQNQQF